MAHTPGPWELDGVEIYPVNGHRASDAICEMKPGFLDADAQLIAAAPALLAELQYVANMITADEAELISYRRIAAVIAKATGAA